MASTRDRYLVVKGKAGLGNRMLSALGGILFARLTQRQLIIDWGDESYSNDGTNVFPLLFRCPEVEPLSILPDTDSISPRLWRGRMARSAAEVIQEVDPSAHTSRGGYRSFSADLSRLDHSETVLVMWSYSHNLPILRRHFHGRFAHLASKSDEQILTELLRTSLLLHPSIRASIDKWRNDHFGCDTLIGTHIRFMDTRFPLLPFLDRRTSIDSVFDAIDRIMHKVSDPTIFVATDKKEAEQLVESRYSKVIYTSKWFPSTGMDLHQNRECPDKVANAIEALVDMYLLAECNYLVFPASSTFSYISSLYTCMPRDNIIDIERTDPIIQIVKFARRWFA